MSLENPDELGRYWDPRFNRNVVKLLPGGYYACDSEEMIVTVLGSCITVCLFESVLKIGGMNHFMLPGDNNTASSPVTNNTSAARYGSVAMEWLVNDIMKMGGQRQNLSAKMFGGGSVTSSKIDIGEQNIQFAKAYCEFEGIPVVSADVGGVCPRKLYYIPRTNDAYVKTITKTHSSTIAQHEDNYRRQLNRLEQTNNVFYLEDN